MLFPDMLRVERLNQGISQAKLAERAGFDHSYVSRLESSQRKPTPDAIKRLAKALGHDPNGDFSVKLLISAGFIEPGYAIVPHWPSVIKLHEFLERNDIPHGVRRNANDIVSAMIDTVRDTYKGGSHDVSDRRTGSD